MKIYQGDPTIPLYIITVLSVVPYFKPTITMKCQNCKNRNIRIIRISNQKKTNTLKIKDACVTEI